MSEEASKEYEPHIRLPLWMVLDALHSLEGDDYCNFRDEIVKAWKLMEDGAFEDMMK